MKKKYDVVIDAPQVLYPGIEANSEEEAIQIALEWFMEYIPDVTCGPAEED